MTTRSITEGPIFGTVLRLAWPVIVGEALHTAFHITDTAWVSGLGTDATAALTTSMFVVWVQLALAALVNTGLTAHVSQNVGAGNPAAAGQVATQGAHLAFLLGIVLAGVGWLGAPWIFQRIGAPAGVREQAVEYVRVLSLGSPAAFLYLSSAATMRATGDTRTPLRITAVSVVANAALTPFFVYVLHMGVTGAAAATVICELGATIAFARLALRGHPALPFDRATLGRFDWRAIGSLARVGTPYCVVISLFSIVYLVFSWLAATFGAVAMAVVGIGNRLESLCYLTADGFAAAAATMVGQNLGAGNVARARRSAWHATGAMSVAAAVLTILFVAIPEPLMALFTRDPAVIAQGAVYLRILAVCQIATGVEGVLAGGFAGAGDTVPPLVIHAAISIVRIPLAWWLAIQMKMGLEGVAWTISGTCVLRGAVIALLFLRGGWARRRGLAVAARPEVTYARGGA
jgi:putative MATE family efflux protein